MWLILVRRVAHVLYIYTWIKYIRTNVRDAVMRSSCSSTRRRVFQHTGELLHTDWMKCRVQLNGQPAFPLWLCRWTVVSQRWWPQLFTVLVCMIAFEIFFGGFRSSWYLNEQTFVLVFRGLGGPSRNASPPLVCLLVACGVHAARRANAQELV